MNTHAAHAAQSQRPTDIGCRDFYQPCLCTDADTSGSVPITAAMQRRAKLVLLGLRRMELRHESQRLRNLRRNKAASVSEAELRAVVNEILAMGPQPKVS